MLDFLSFIDNMLWGSVILWLLCGTGIWFTITSRLFPFRILKEIGYVLRQSTSPHSHGLTPFQALCTSLAGRVGTGNLAGVALALVTGGPGAIFWMWLSALLSLGTAFAESSLAQLYKGRDASGHFRGGPAWYMERALGMRWMGVLFAVFLIISFGGVFNAIQANSIAQAMHHAFQIPVWASTLALALFTGGIIFRGIRGVAHVTQWLVPLVAISWVAIGFGMLIWHIDQLPAMFSLIIRNAFGWQEAAAGTLGYTFGQALTSGFLRGVFSHEAGVGAAPNIAAAAVSTPPHPATQGIVQMVGVCVDTMLICTSTAAIIMLSGVLENGLNPEDGNIITQQAISILIGPMGNNYLAIVLLLFAFSAIIANYAYAENNLVFLGYDKPLWLTLFRSMILLNLVAGSFISLPILWHMADVVMALMVMINLTSILLLSPTVKIIADDYLRQRKLGLNPIFDARRHRKISGQITPGIWERKADE